MNNSWNFCDVFGCYLIGVVIVGVFVEGEVLGMMINFFVLVLFDLLLVFWLIEKNFECCLIFEVVLYYGIFIFVYD